MSIIIGITCVIAFIFVIWSIISAVNFVVSMVKDRKYMQSEPVHFNYDGRRITAYVRRIRRRRDGTYHIVSKHQNFQSRQQRYHYNGLCALLVTCHNQSPSMLLPKSFWLYI
jgi:hypothetical protein